MVLKTGLGLMYIAWGCRRGRVRGRAGVRVVREREDGGLLGRVDEDEGGSHAKGGPSRRRRETLAAGRQALRQAGSRFES